MSQPDISNLPGVTILTPEGTVSFVMPQGWQQNTALHALQTLLARYGNDLYLHPDNYREQLYQWLDNLAKMPEGFIFWTHLLIQLVIVAEDSELRRRALKLLKQIKNDYQINSICRLWATSRNPELERLLVEMQWVASEPAKLKTLTLLKIGQLDNLLAQAGKREVRALVELLDDSDAVVVARARKCLEMMDSKTWALDLLATVWLQKRQPFLLDIITRSNYLPQKPLETRVRVALKCGRLDILTNAKANLVTHLVEAAEDADPVIAEQTRQVLSQLKKPEAQQALCKLVIERDLPFAQEIALRQNYLPIEAHQKALFYFVTEQWERYESLDFDQHILRAAYEAANPAFRRRLAEKVRVAGRVSYLTAIAGGDSRSRAASLSLEEAKLLVQILAANREWAKLWPLVFELPLEWSVNAVRLISQTGWQPEKSEEQAVFEQLRPLALKAIVTNEAEAEKQLPPALLRARARVPGRINAIAFSPTQPWLAIGTGTGKLVIWNMQTARREQMLDDFKHSIGQAVFTPGGRLVLAERASTETAPCAVYSWEKGAPDHLGQHIGPVTALHALKDERVLSAGRDSRVILWNLKEAREIGSTGDILMNDWPRGLCLSPEEGQVAISGKKVRLFSLPDLRLLNFTATNMSWMVQHLAFAPDSKALALGRPNGELLVYPIKPNGELSQNPARLNGGEGQLGQLQALFRLPNLPLLVSARTNGTVEFVDWSRQASIGQVQAPGERLTSLTFSPDGYFMAVGDSNASFSLWDLRVLELRQLFVRPLAQGRAVHMAALAALQDSGPTLSSALQASLSFIEIILRHRMRHDVELDEAISIQAGNFDIEL
jgi:WD40 repeat protein